MTKLSINLNKIALLRNQRQVGYPSVVESAKCVITAGAAGLTVHPRPDERHIRISDVWDLQKLWKSLPDGIEYNIEGYPSADWLQLVHDVKPTQATLVPDAPEANTSDDGWDAVQQKDFLQPIIADLQSKGIRTCLFLNADAEQVTAAKATGTDRIEFYTGPYAETFEADKKTAIAKYVEAAKIANDIGLGINAGHDLSLQNLSYFAENIDGLLEVSIGHAFIADALWLGLEKSVQAYLNALR